MSRLLGNRPAFVLLPVLAVTYNAILAILGTFGIPLSFAIAALCEILILALTLVLVTNTGFRQSDKPFLLCMTAFVLLTVYLNLVNGTLLITSFRNFLIIFTFAMLGLRLSFVELNRIFIICTVIVLTFLIIEIADLSLYVSIFEPANYFAQTRGNEIAEFNEVGVFGNALSFESRFSYGLFDGPRTSSIFLEQVSLANFATMICLYLLAFNRAINKSQRFLMLLTVFLIVTSSNARTTSILTIVLFLGYFIFPLLPRFFNGFVAILVFCTALTVYILNPNAKGDDLKGRIRLSMDHFFELGFGDYIGLGANNLDHLWDAGYAYMIAANSIVGAAILCYLVLFTLQQRYRFSKRLAYGVTLYVFVNMLIGGNTVYSMKVATLQWVLVGFVIAYEKSYLTAIEKNNLDRDATA